MKEDLLASGGTVESQPSTQTGRGPFPGLRRRPEGRFITFEGIEGSGKSTQIQRLAERLEEADETVTLTREPGGSRLGLRLRSLLLEDSRHAVHPLAELLLYAADRAQHLAEVVEPALSRGEVVLCDRYLDATLAYQGYGRGIDLDVIRGIHRHPPLDRRPFRTFLLDLDPEVGLERARSRNRDLGLTRAEGRFEGEPTEFHARVRDGYLALAEAEPFRWRIIDAGARPEAVQARICDLLSDVFPALDGDEP